MESAWGAAAIWRVALLAYLGMHGVTSPPARATPVCLAANASGVSAVDATGAPPASTSAPADAASRILAAANPVIDPEVQPLLARACFPCHSDERADPWYAKLAPSSWSTRGARDVLNFSAWASYDDARRGRAAGAIAALTAAGTMPPADYTFFNHQARLSDDEKRTIVRWASEPQP